MRKLGHVQKGVLREIAKTGWYYPGCGWAWDGDTVCVRICETLVARGLLRKIPVTRSSWCQEYRYELTKTGEVEADIRGYRPPETKWGYAIMVEKDAIRQRLVDSGMTDLRELHFAVVRAYEAAHKGDKTLRERQEERRLLALEKWQAEQALKPKPPEPIVFTMDELDRLIEHFAQANDPVSASIGEKAKALKASGKRLGELPQE